jgi:hypothetical protein
MLFTFKLNTNKLAPILQQDDIRNFIDSSLKHGYHLPIFRKERIGGDSYGISYWWENNIFKQKWKTYFWSTFVVGASLLIWCNTGMKTTPSLGIGCIAKLDGWSTRSKQENLKEKVSRVFRSCLISGRL